MSGRIFSATFLLISGVAFTGGQSPFWQVVGGVCLAFVPALIADHVVSCLHPRHPSRLDLLISLAEQETQWAHPPNFPPGETLDPPATETETPTPKA